MDRRTWDRLVSTASIIIAVVMIVLGGLAIYGGNFGRQNVRDRLEPQQVFFAPLDAMTPEEKATVGEFAGQQVVNGEQAKGFSDYIAGHLVFVNDGKTYAETSGAAREEGLAPDVAAELQGKADVLFKGETLRAIMLNAYGWWMVSTIAFWAGWFMVIAGIVLAVLAIMGFRHAKRYADAEASEGAHEKEYATQSA